MTYPNALRYLDSLINYETRHDYDYRKSFGLGTITKLCAHLGDPQRAVKAVQVAGSKGKGSTAVFIASILRAAGLKTGLYTSPHLDSFRERIRVDGTLIGEDDLGRLLEKVRDAAGKMGAEQPTYFEVVTALAYLYFQECMVDVAVYETGLGGRLDATTVVTPLVSVITPISYEHSSLLGDTLAKIASEKAGIIKEGGICVSAPQDEEARCVIEQACGERHAAFVLVGRDNHYQEVRATDEKEVFSVTGPGGTYPDLETGLLGSHQVMNATTAIAAVEQLVASGIAVPEKAVREGIAEARWEGRLEVVGRRPYIILDGAQNRASAAALAAAVKKLFRYKKLILVLGVSRDKDVRGIADELLPVADVVFLTKAQVPGRALEPAAMKDQIGAGEDTVVTATVSEALDRATAAAGPDDLILVTGSLFVVGEARRKMIYEQALS